MISGVLFDLGDTVLLTDWDAIHAQFEARTGLSIRMSARIKKLYVREVLTGTRSLVDLFVMFKEEQRNPHEIDELIATYAELYEQYTRVDQDLIGLVRQLKSRVFVACVTNTNDVHARINRRRGVYDYFHKAYVSCEVGMRKPQRELFSFIAEEDLIPVDRLLFMDDHLENIKAARLVGLKTIHFENKPDFFDDMRILFPHLR
ncbi:MAG: HAD-IA family hydrolase [Candidatus Woesearchaeota archaeon]